MNSKKLLALISVFALAISASAFTIVLDAGHGGHDAGAVGSMSKEKNINLRHVTLVGDMLQERNPEIKVIYTRSKDVFVELNERARIANKNKADLFVSIHTNSSKNKTASGIEVFTLGVSRSKENMDVAMLENSVILLEEDHESKYQGFDPNSTDSYIMFEFMKDQYNERSIECAEQIQNKLVESSGRVDRSVRQAGFLVLRATTMPSVLVELGFISNPTEEKKLNNDDEQIANAEAIYNGIIAYIHSLEKKGGEQIVSISQPQNRDSTAVTVPADTVRQSVPAAPKEEKQEAVGNKDKVNPSTTIDENKVIYKLQVLVSSTKRKTSDAVFCGRKDVEESYADNIYKYYIGATNNYNEAVETKNSTAANFKGAFIVAFKNGVRVNVQETLK